MVHVCLNVTVRCNIGQGRESGGCAEERGIYSEANVWQEQLFGIPFKVLIYDDLMGIARNSGHVTLMAIKSFDPLDSKTLQSSRLYLLKSRLTDCGIGNFCVFLQKKEENVKNYFHRIINADDAETRFLTNYRLF